MGPTSQPTEDVAAEYLSVDWQPTSLRYDSHSAVKTVSNRQAHSLSLSIPTTRFTNSSPSPDASPVPPLSTPASDSSQNDSLDTPLSSSPISGVVDLTMSVTTLADSPVTTGGFSDIYRGTWTAPRNGKTVMVAVKLLRVFSVQDYEAARKRLNWEVYVWHRLKHPNIATLFGTSYHMSNRPSMIMQWYENGNATEFLRGPNGANADRNSLVLDVARGLEYLHTLMSPIIHGDLKGNNVLITDDMHAVISDFGLSQVIRAMQDRTGLTPSNLQPGPTRWQAPELHKDETQPDLATDVWGFGCTAYEMLSGNIPYYYRQRDAGVIKDVENRIKPSGPDGIFLQQPYHDMETILDQCWEFIPSQRPSMSHLVAQLAAITEKAHQT